MTSFFHYFAYGSNMLTEWLQGRCPSAKFVDTARLADHKLEFSKKSIDCSGKATLVCADGLDVYGVIFRIGCNEKSKLDTVEGPGYECKKIEVHQVSIDEKIEVYTYLATSRDTALKPYDWYHNLVLAGACQHKLPKTYQDFIRLAVESIDDKCPDREKRKEARKVLQDSGFAHLNSGFARPK